jgi:hypothetical protein
MRRLRLRKTHLRRICRKTNSRNRNRKWSSLLRRKGGRKGKRKRRKKERKRRNEDLRNDPDLQHMTHVAYLLEYTAYG